MSYLLAAVIVLLMGWILERKFDRRGVMAIWIVEVSDMEAWHPVKRSAGDSRAEAKESEKIMRREQRLFGCWDKCKFRVRKYERA